MLLRDFMRDFYLGVNDHHFERGALRDRYVVMSRNRQNKHHTTRTTEYSAKLAAVHCCSPSPSPSPSPAPQSPENCGAVSQSPVAPSSSGKHGHLNERGCGDVGWGAVGVGCGRGGGLATVVTSFLAPAQLPDGRLRPRY